MAAGLPRTHGAGEVDCACVQEELFSEGGLAGIRVGDDGECAPTGGLGGEVELGHEGLGEREGGA